MSYKGLMTDVLAAVIMIAIFAVILGLAIAFERMLDTADHRRDDSR